VGWFEGLPGDLGLDRLDAATGSKATNVITWLQKTARDQLSSQAHNPKQPPTAPT